jgi:hypothetical protein
MLAENNWRVLFKILPVFEKMDRNVGVRITVFFVENREKL